MASYDEKNVGISNDPPFTHDARNHSITSYPDSTTRRKSRKESVVAAIKNNYGLVEADAASIKLGQDTTHRKLKPRHIQ
jgi:transcriptional regulator of acetoin/glycerol metabolism